MTAQRAEFAPRDVIIAGAGPVGLTLANILGRYGVSVLVLEAGDRLIDYPRGVGLDDESLRVFQSLGLVDQVLPHTVPNQILRFLNRRGDLIAEIAPVAKPYGWPRRNGFVQPLVDAVLLRGLDRYPHVEVRFGHTLEGLNQDDAEVVAIVRDQDGAVADVPATFLVGCDGGRSQTRRLLDVTFEGTSSPTRWLVVDLANDPLGSPNIYVGADPDRPFVSVGISHGIRRFEFMVKDGEGTEEATERDFLHERLAAFVADPDSVEVIRSRVYTHHSRIAGTFRKGRVMLAGDAAHLMPVWQGQGYNSGIRDAANLGWKLAAVVNGEAGGSLLDSYDLERRKHAMAMIQLSTWVGRVISPTNRYVARLRDILLAGASHFPALKSYIVEMRFKPMPCYDSGAVVHAADSDRESSPVGKLFMQPMVSTREAEAVLLDDVLGSGFAVLCWNNSPRRVLDKESVQTWLTLGARFISVRPATQLDWTDQDDDDVTVVGDVSGQLKTYFDDHAESVLFIRPDRCVAAAGDAQDAPRLSRELFAALDLTTSRDLVPAWAGDV